MSDIYGDEFLKFVAEHSGENADRLRLRYQRGASESVRAAIAHIEASAKGRRKFPGIGDGWVFPSLLSVEQSTPPATAAFNVSTALHLFDDPLKLRVLDMTAGLGMDALGFARMGHLMTLCEINPAHAEALRHNFAPYPSVKVVDGDSTTWLAEYYGEKFDVIFIDPARRDASGGRVYNLHDCTPDITALLPMLQRNARLIVAKLSPMLDTTQTLRDLPGCSELHIVEENGECRELLAVIPSEGSKSPAEIVIDKPQDGFTFRFIPSENGPEAVFVAPDILGGPYGSCSLHPGQYIVEPSSSLMKAGCFGRICHDFDLKMLAPNSHAFVSDKPVGAPIGIVSRITEIFPFASGKLRAIGRKIGAAEVIARNLPGITSELLRKKLGVGESSERRVLGTTVGDGARVLIVLDKQIQVSERHSSKYDTQSENRNLNADR